MTRPSGKAALIAGSLALTLVVGATSGAVAGGLITSKDIKNNTIRGIDIHKNAVKNSDIGPGAVSWDKSLDQATKDLIEGLAQSGAAGPPGVQGPAGPEGPVGPTGGHGRDAELVAWNTFDGDGVFDPLISGSMEEALPDGFPAIGYVKLAGDHSVNVGPGTYLVSMRATTDVTELAEALSDVDPEADPTAALGAVMGLFGVISPKAPLHVTSVPITEDDGDGGEIVTANTVSATVDTETLSQSCLNIIVCNTSYAVTVPAGQTMDLSNLWLLTFGNLCDEDGLCTSPVKVNVAVTTLAGTPANFISVPPYTVSMCAAVADPAPEPDPCAAPEKRLRPKQLKGFIQDLVPSAS